MGSPLLYVGLMSGTSLDGVDAVLVQFEGMNQKLIHTKFLPFDENLRTELLALNQAGFNELERTALAGNALATLYARAVHELLSERSIAATEISAIGCHGQTVRHRPDLGFTSQIGNAALLAELTDITVVADFRSRDIAAKGQGAPLVPAFHAAAFSSTKLNRVIINIGGVSNLTWLPTNGKVTGFDCGPGNLLLDSWIQKQKGVSYDKDGTWASTGKIIPDLLHHLLDHDFFSRPPPKSTGRDEFHADWLATHLDGTEPPADVQNTLVELSARALSMAIQKHCSDTDEIFLCGGGAHNTALTSRLKTLLPGIPIQLTDKLGVGADWVEGAAFAWLAKRAMEGLPGNLPEVTGANGPRVLGAIHKS
ncbi:MAG: anhydro-N-acetylmuramic acid kinase [Sulfuricellaceae bacterium]|nr:anhydro-N-acetylmuramic acid kinase [Sulfuricellaceae bacterium]